MTSLATAVLQAQTAVSRCVRAGALIMLLCAMSGCALGPHREVQIDPTAVAPQSIAAAQPYQTALVSYRVDCSRLRAAVRSSDEARQVAYEPTAKHFRAGTVATLSVKYPHPEGKVGYALAEVVIEDAPGRGNVETPPSGWRRLARAFGQVTNDDLPGMKYSDGVHEAWAIDVPRSQLDGILFAVQRQGYYAYPPPPRATVQLATYVDTGNSNKPWQQVPELDALVERVRNEGRLVSYVRPTESAQVFAAPAPIAALPR